MYVEVIAANRVCLHDDFTKRYIGFETAEEHSHVWTQQA